MSTPERASSNREAAEQASPAEQKTETSGQTFGPLYAPAKLKMALTEGRLPGAQRQATVQKAASTYGNRQIQRLIGNFRGIQRSENKPGHDHNPFQLLAPLPVVNQTVERCACGGGNTGAAAAKEEQSGPPCAACQAKEAQRLLAPAPAPTVFKLQRSFGLRPAPGLLRVVQRFGANPGCTPAQVTTIHARINAARAMVMTAIGKLRADPVAADVRQSLRRNFGPTYGVVANKTLIANRLQTAHGEMNTMTIACRDATDATCADGNCGYTNGAGSHDTVLCTNSTLADGTDPMFQTLCVLHEAFHAAFSNFTFDNYSGWNGLSGNTDPYPGPGTEPLLNADSYTTLVLDLA